MGLDQYLYVNKRLYTSEFLVNITSEDTKISAFIVDTLNLNSFVTDLSFTIIELKILVFQWRKSNQIHRWFVENCQDGIDECQTVEVSRTKLEKLIELCEEVLENHSLAETLLPVGNGFFFGSDDYDEFYFADLKETAKKLTNLILNIPDIYDFLYSSSW